MISLDPYSASKSTAWDPLHMIASLWGKHWNISALEKSCHRSMYEYSESFFVSVQGVPLGPRGPQVTRHLVWAQGSDQGPCIHALAPSYGTTCCHLTHSSKIPPCLLTQLLAPSFSSRRCAGDSRRRRLSLELYNPSKGKRLLKMNVRAILSLCWMSFCFLVCMLPVTGLCLTPGFLLGSSGMWWRSSREVAPQSGRQCSLRSALCPLFLTASFLSLSTPTISFQQQSITLKCSQYCFISHPILPAF